MKKIITLALTLILMLSLTACGRTMDNVTSGAESMVDSVTSGAESVADRAGSAVQSATDNMTGGDMQLTAKISAKEAEEAALKHAGLSETEVTDVDIDLDRDNGVLIYEVDFNAGGTEYDYDINAETGAVISADKDRG